MTANAALGARSFALLQSLTVAAALGALLPPALGRGSLPPGALVGQIVLAAIAIAGGLVAVGSYRVVRRELSARTRGEAVARSQAHTDELTGVLNRRGFRTLAEQQLRVARRSGADLLVLYVDLVGFKGINDRYGHAEGDRALREVAALLQRTMRDSDLVARLGGDEFGILMVAGTPEAERAVRARLDAALSAYNGVPGQRFPIALTIGAARFDGSAGSNLDDLLRTADAQLYRRRNPMPRRATGEWSAVPSAA